jgi:tetratricopeptide (TPR) repeat protein
LPVFERSGDAAGAATSWAVLGGLSWGRCQARHAETAWRRAIDLFRAAGNRWLESEYLAWLSSAPAWGPTPCETALRELEALAEEARGSPSAELDVAASVGTVLMMLGDLDGARARFEACGQRMRELGRTLPLAHSSQQLGLLELLSGRAAEAEAILGPSSRTLEQMGSDALSIISAFHAEALYALGRYDEADDAAVKAAAFEDTSSTTIGLSVQGMVAARRGRFAEAEELAARAIATIDETDFIVDRADARSALAEVFELAGRIEEATAVARDALALYEEKGNVLQAGHARARLDRLTG